jgi:hypothetical protein
MFEKAGKYNFVLMPISRINVTVFKTVNGYGFGKLGGICLHSVDSCAVIC